MSVAHRHPIDSAVAATSGRKMSCPVAPPAVRMPMTRPRLFTNHAFASVAASTSAIDVTTRIPNRAMSAAANGAMRP